MRLLREFVMDTQNVVKDKDYYISGIFMQGNIQNRNGRIYPIDVLEQAVEKYLPTIQEKMSYGELRHPDTPNIDHERVSHYVTELYRDGDNFIGKAKIMNTPMGKIVKAIMDEGCKVCVSSRGLGSVKEIKGSKVVQNDFTLVTAADIVSDPSAPKAIVENLIESAEWEFDGKEWIPAFRKQAKQIADLAVIRKNKEEVYLKLFREFVEKF